MPKNVVVLGGGTFQLGLIKVLKQCGFNVHVVTNRKNDVGSKEAIRTHLISYKDLEKVLDLCKEINAYQVFSVASEASLFSQSYLQKALGLKGNSPELVTFLGNKKYYKEKLQEKLPEAVPQFIIANNHDRLKQFFLQNAETGVILKPVEGSGSRNISLIQSKQEVNNLNLQDLSKEYIVEKYIAGKEYGGDIIVLNKSILFYYPTVKSVNENHVPVSHLILQKAHAIQGALTKFLQKILNVLNLSDGVYNVDILVNDEKPYLVDIGPRIGGNGIPDLVLLSFKINEWLFMIEFLTGEVETAVKPVWQSPHGVYIIHSKKEGILSSTFPGADSFNENLVEVYWKVSPGDKIENFTEGSKHLGYVIYRAETDEELLYLQTLIESYEWFSLQ